MSALGSLFTEDFMSLHCIDLYETDRLLLFRPKSSIWKTIDLERVIEKAENIFNFYLDSNWEFRFIETKIRILFDTHFLMIKWCNLTKSSAISYNRTTEIDLL